MFASSKELFVSIIHHLFSFLSVSNQTAKRQNAKLKDLTAQRHSGFSVPFSAALLFACLHLLVAYIIAENRQIRYGYVSYIRTWYVSYVLETGMIE